MSITATTRLVALLGDPVDRSLSPRFQNAGFTAEGLNAVYVALRCDAVHVPGLMRGLALAGGAGNITRPHKEVAAAALDRASDSVLATGACNTFWGSDGLLHGDNTDVEGFTRAAETLAGSLAGKRVLLLGAGGAARAAAHALVLAGAEGVLHNRRPGRAVALLEEIPGAASMRIAETPEELRGLDFDLVVNATSLGMHACDSMPLDLDLLGRAGAVIDMVYRAGGTPWMRHASVRGVPAADGTEMLLQQGALAFERWFGRPAPLAAMRQALEAGGSPTR